MGRSLGMVAVAVALLFASPAGALGALSKCPHGQTGMCGSVAVPLDRSNPGGTKLDIHFVVFQHTAKSQPAQGTIFITEGGPGESVINGGERVGYPDFVFKSLLDHRDLV